LQPGPRRYPAGQEKNDRRREFRDLAGEPPWKLFNTFRSGTRIPGGEMMIQAQSRVITFLEKISHEFDGRMVAAVYRADVIRAAICHYTGVPLDLSLRVEISPASLSVLEKDCGARLIRLNDTGELLF
jgi:broad specificity phosphatase PhoE